MATEFVNTEHGLGTVDRWECDTLNNEDEFSARVTVIADGKAWRGHGTVRVLRWGVRMDRECAKKLALKRAIESLRAVT